MLGSAECPHVMERPDQGALDRPNLLNGEHLSITPVEVKDIRVVFGDTRGPSRWQQVQRAITMVFCPLEALPLCRKQGPHRRISMLTHTEPAPANTKLGCNCGKPKLLEDLCEKTNTNASSPS